MAYDSVVNWYNDGIRHFAYSNYHPSFPSYPFTEDPYWSLGNTEDVTRFEAWKLEHSITDLLQSPNAEHHLIQTLGKRAITYLHMNSIGSTFATGKPIGETPQGANIPWTELIDRAIAGLQYEDGGGVTINHPIWTMDTTNATKLTMNLIYRMLDYDPRVLGIEIYNHTCERSTHNGWALEMFDQILSTGRRCWGLAVPDHDFPGFAAGNVAGGRNVLLVPEATEHECLKAYRDGRFYAKIYGTALKFDDISLNGRTVTVSAPNAEQIEMVTNRGTEVVRGSVATFTIPLGAIYVRVHAHGLGDDIFSNPIMLNDGRPIQNTDDIVLFYD